MNEVTVHDLCSKLVKLKFIKGFSIIDKKETLPLYFSLTPYVIFQNTKTRADFTQFSDQIGHWVCYYVKNHKNSIKILYFDSFGRIPLSYSLQVPFNTFIVNTVPYQQAQSLSCGLFCLMFVVMQSLGFNISHMHQMFYCKDSDSVEEILNQLYCLIKCSPVSYKYIRKRLDTFIKHYKLKQ